MNADRRLAQVRRWERVTLPAPATALTTNNNNASSLPSASHHFTLLSYNVLSQRLLEAHQWLYAHASPHYTRWAVRAPLIWQQIRQIMPDFVCLQEVEKADIANFWLPMCKQSGYELSFKCRSSYSSTSDGTSKSDGCALLWRTDQFTAQHIQPIELRRPDCTVLDRDNVAIVAHFRSRRGAGDLLVATTHLLFNQRRSDVRLAQCCLLMAALHQAANNNSNNNNSGGATKPPPATAPLPLPLVLCGDFNLQPHTPVYRFICGERVRYAGTSASSLLADECGDRQLSPPLFSPQIGLDQLCRLRRDQHHHQQQQQQQHHCQQQQHQQQQQHCRHDNSHMTSATDGFSSNNNSSSSSTTNNNNSGSVSRHAGDDGSLQHDVAPLHSVYSHYRTDGSTTSSSSSSRGGGKYCTTEATTHQNEWITVDYVFYGDGSGGGGGGGRRLWPLRRLALPSADLCDQLSPYPSAAMPSDHLPLAVTFVLANSNNNSGSNSSAAPDSKGTTTSVLPTSIHDQYDDRHR